MTKTEGQTLASVLPELKEAYEAWKHWEADKNARKAEFFALADQALTANGLAGEFVTITCASEAQAAARVRLHYPAWMIEAQRAHRVKPDVWEFVLKANPSYQQFSIELNGVKYSRTVSTGPVMIDDDWISEDDPELYQQVTYELPWGDRVAIPMEGMDPELIGRLTPYLYNGTPRVSLAAPRPVKDES